MSSIRIKIKHDSITQYQYGLWSDVTEIEWRAGPLISSVLRNFPNLRVLDCSYNELETLAGIDQCPQLVELHCGYNHLVSLEGIGACPALEILACYRNRLRSLEHIPVGNKILDIDCCTNPLRLLKGIDVCTSLRNLDCSGCNLGSLEGIEACTALEYLRCINNGLTSIQPIASCSKLDTLLCFNNRITQLTGVESCPNLQTLYFHENLVSSIQEIKSCRNLRGISGRDNTLTTLKGIESCILLEELSCGTNQLSSLAGIECCTALQSLSCGNNQITVLDPVVYLPNLRLFSYNGNPLTIQTIQVERFLRQHQITHYGSSIYTDNQNVHSRHIQKSVCDSVRNLLTDPKPVFTIELAIESDLDPKTVSLIAEFCADETVHSTHLLTYAELLAYVWQRISLSEHKVELLKILAEQVRDAECKCFTGRFNRALSVLVGFYPDITITISDSSRISAIILAIQQRLDPYDPATHRLTARRELIEAGYTEAEIKPWLEAIHEYE